MRTVPATPDHIPGLLARMGETQRAEVDAIGGAARLAELISASVVTWCGLDDEGAVLIGGLTPMDAPGFGYVWQVITPAVARHKRAYLEQGRAMLKELLAISPRLMSVIKTDYAAALRHVRRLGGQVGNPREVDGTMVCLCERKG